MGGVVRIRKLLLVVVTVTGLMLAGASPSGGDERGDGRAGGLQSAGHVTFSGDELIVVDRDGKRPSGGATVTYSPEMGTLWVSEGVAVIDETTGQVQELPAGLQEAGRRFVAQHGLDAPDGMVTPQASASPM